jgi:hypothetical protein
MHNLFFEEVEDVLTYVPHEVFVRFQLQSCVRNSWLGDFGPTARRVHRRRWKEQDNEGYCIVRRSIFCNIYKLLLRVSISRDMSWAGHIACMGEMRNVCTYFVGKLNFLRGISERLI